MIKSPETTTSQHSHPNVTPTKQPKATLSIRFHALDEKTFCISDVSQFPIVIGGESNMKWKIIEANKETIPSRLGDTGYALMTKIDTGFVDSVSTQGQEVLRALSDSQCTKRLAFTKIPYVKRACGIIRINSQGSPELCSLQKILLNDREIENFKYVELKNSDKIIFLGEDPSTAIFPLLYHLIISENSVCHQSLASKPIIEEITHPLYLQKLHEINSPKYPQPHVKWSTEEMQKLKKCLLMFGLHRWSKIRFYAKKICKPLSQRSDDEMRCYSNFFLISVASCLQSNQSLLEVALELIETTDKDIKLECNASDFADNFTSQADKWAKRLNLSRCFMKLVRSFKNSQTKFNSIPYQVQEPKLQKLYQSNKNLLNFIPETILSIGKPAVVWTRQHDVDLILGTYDHGFSNYDDIFSDKNLILKDTSQGKFKPNLLTRRLKYLAKCIILHTKQHGDKYEFERQEEIKESKEPSGLSLNEKNILYEILINYGIPVSPLDESKEDFQLLKILFAKYAKGEDAETNCGIEAIKVLEKFIQNLNTISAKIISDYRIPVQEILKQWKEEDEEDSDQASDSSGGSTPKEIPKPQAPPQKAVIGGPAQQNAKTQQQLKEEEVNDFRIDKERIKAAHEYEKHCQRLVYDPDSDGFNFGYERALTFRVRTNMFKIIRKEIISNDYKLFDSCIDAWSAKFKEDRDKGLTKLPEEWICDKHDRYLLKAVSENGLSFLSKLKQNADYGFDNVSVTKKRLQKRLEQLCLYFKDHLFKFRKVNAVKPGDLTTGENTKLEIKKHIPNITVNRDEHGNIKYPIEISPTLQILNLGTIEYERINYHSEKNFFPIGFKSLREYTSMFKVGQRCQYICEILDGGAKPLFKVTCSEDPNNPLIRDSSSGVWIDICKRINEIQGNKRTNVTVSGPDRYGLAEPAVNNLLMCLPNSDKCVKYRFQ